MIKPTTQSKEKNQNIKRKFEKETRIHIKSFIVYLGKLTMTEKCIEKMDTDYSAEEALQHRDVKTGTTDCQMNENHVQNMENSYMDANKMNESINETQEYDMVLQLKMLEELQLLRTELLAIRINCLVIKDDVRENTMLTKRLWDTLRSVDAQIQDAASRKKSEESIVDDKNK